MIAFLKRIFSKPRTPEHELRAQRIDWLQKDLAVSLESRPGKGLERASRESQLQLVNWFARSNFKLGITPEDLVTVYLKCHPGEDVHRDYLFRCSHFLLLGLWPSYARIDSYFASIGLTRKRYR